MSCSETEEVVVSRFTEKMYRNARTVTTGMVTGEPYEPVRHTWLEVHERARAVAVIICSELRVWVPTWTIRR